MLKIWGRTNSINVQKVLWTCGELGLAYERIDAGLQFGVVGTPEYKAMNPNSRIPTISDNGFVLWESNTIVRYLSSKYSIGGLMPAELTARADAERWMDWVTSTLNPAVTPVFWGLIRTAPEKRDMKTIDAARLQCETLFGILDQALAHKQYIIGDTLTVGDIPIGAYAYRWMSLPIERPRLASLEAWYARLQARAAYRQHVMLPLS